MALVVSDTGYFEEILYLPLHRGWVCLESLFDGNRHDPPQPRWVLLQLMQYGASAHTHTDIIMYISLMCILMLTVVHGHWSYIININTVSPVP